VPARGWIKSCPARDGTTRMSVFAEFLEVFAESLNTSFQAISNPEVVVFKMACIHLRGAAGAKPLFAF
jgi:hypothetical protein